MPFATMSVTAPNNQKLGSNMSEKYETAGFLQVRLEVEIKRRKELELELCREKYRSAVWKTMFDDEVEQKTRLSLEVKVYDEMLDETEEASSRNLKMRRDAEDEMNAALEQAAYYRKQAEEAARKLSELSSN